MNTLTKPHIRIKEDKYLSSNVRHTKVYIDKILYKRIEYSLKGKPFCIQWLQDNQYMDDLAEQNLEKIYNKIEKPV
jgi:hypothetical protein